MRTYRPTVNDGDQVRDPVEGCSPSQWTVYDDASGLPMVIADCDTEERAQALVAELPPIFCPHCGYTGGDDYDLSPGFRYMEVIESFYAFELDGSVLKVDPYSLDPDAEQEPSVRKLHCESCNKLFDLPEGVKVHFD